MSTMEAARPRRPPLTGIDALLEDPPRWLRGGRVGLLANQASLTGDGRPTLEALRAHPDVRLSALLAPEHGWSGFGEDATPIGDAVDARTGLPVHSLYGPRRRPDSGLLRELDVIVVDLQEVGVRCYTYAASVALLLDAAGEAGTRVVVCDRPNLLGRRIAGPPLDPPLRSFLAFLDVPYQHGLTLGELALWHAAGRLAGRVELEVVPVAGWSRGDPSPGPWVPPSPGLAARDAALLYPGTVLVEAVNLSEGRGTPLPFQLLGAPWLEPYRLSERLRALRLPGLRFRPLTFVPETGTFAHETCHGVQLHVTEPSKLAAFEAVVTILAHLWARGSQLAWVDAAEMPWNAGSDALESALGDSVGQRGEGGPPAAPWLEPARGSFVDALTGSTEVRAIVEGRARLEEQAPSWRASARAFIDAAAPHLLYPPAPEPA